MQAFGDISIYGVAAAPIIVALLALATRLGLNTKYAPWVNLVLQVAVYGASLYLMNKPEFKEPVVAGLSIIIGFLTTCGLFDRTERVIVNPIRGAPAA